MRIVRQYNEQLRHAGKLTLGTALAAIVGSALLEVAAPYLQARIIGWLHTATLRDLIESLLWYYACMGLGSFLVPLRKKLRRFIQDEGETRLLGHIERLILLRPRLFRKTHRTSVMAAVEKYFKTWDQYVITMFDQVCSVIVGIGGLLVVLVVTSPILVLPVVVMLVVTIVYAIKIGEAVSKKWSDYTQRATEEYTLIADQASNSHVWWVLKALVTGRKEVDGLRSAALRTYAGAMKRYQGVMELISRGFQVSSFTMGVVSIAAFHVAVEDALVLIIGGMSLGGAMISLFSVNDVLSAKLAEAEMLDKILVDTDPLGPPLPRDTPAVVELNGGRDEDGNALPVVIHREIRDDKTGEVKAVVNVSLPSMILAPARSTVTDLEKSDKPGNVWWIRGPKGCGKTSLSEALCGLHHFTGDITIGELPVNKYDVCGYVINGPQSFDSLSRPAKMLFGGDKSNKLVLKQVLHWVGYPDAPLDRRLDAYSGGQRESLFRAGLFYAAYQAADEDPDAPGILLIDEPTNHLDPESIDAMLDGIGELARRLPNRLVLVNSHCTDMVRVVRPEHIIDLGKKM